MNRSQQRVFAIFLVIGAAMALIYFGFPHHPQPVAVAVPDKEWTQSAALVSSAIGDHNNALKTGSQSDATNALKDLLRECQLLPAMKQPTTDKGLQYQAYVQKTCADHNMP